MSLMESNRTIKNSMSGWYAVFMLLLAYVLSFVDRIIMSLLVTPIKEDLGTTDAQMGLLMGFAFALFYTVIGIPIARLSDVKSRTMIVAVGIFLWSLMTAACGLARSFFQLFLARIGVGVGEAALSPAAYSMISDYFTEDKLGRAIAVYQSGGLFGGGLAFIIGGAVVSMIISSDATSLPFVGILKPWQIAFLIVGLPGILMAFLMLTVKEPTRTGISESMDKRVSIVDALVYMRENWQVYIAIFFGFALLATPITSVLTWIPTYLQRIHGMSIADSGMSLGLMLFFLSSTGVIFGGWLVDYMKRRDYLDSYFRVGLIVCIASVPLILFATSLADLQMTIFVLCPFIFIVSMPLAVGPIVLQVITPNQLRAQVAAVYMLFLNLLTALLGPTGIGLVTDYFFKNDLAIGQSITLINLISTPLAFIFLYFGLIHFNKRLTNS